MEADSLEAVERKNLLLTRSFYLREDSCFYQGNFCLVSSCLPDLKEQVSVLLHPQEISHFSKLSREKQQENYLLGRYAAKTAVSQCESGTDKLLTSIRIDSGVFYQPILYSPGQEKIQISFSHCDGRAVALAFPESHPMGIDLEKSDQKTNSAIEPHLTSHEKKLLMTLNDPGSHTLFWTLKEALSKALRTGLLSPFEIYELKDVDKQDNGCWVAHFRNFPQYQGVSFSLEHWMCSVVYPKKATFDLDVLSLLQKMKREGFLENVVDS